MYKLYTMCSILKRCWWVFLTQSKSHQAPDLSFMHLLYISILFIYSCTTAYKLCIDTFWKAAIICNSLQAVYTWILKIIRRVSGNTNEAYYCKSQIKWIFARNASGMYKTDEICHKRFRGGMMYHYHKVIQ